MKKIESKAIAAFLLLLALAIVFLAPDFTAIKPFRNDKLSIQTSEQHYDFSVEIAENFQQQSLGFMHRDHIPKDHGMLFIWRKDFPITMWMKDTPLSLDMLFIDSHGKIVYIAEKTTPYSEKVIGAGKPVRAVLELVAGTCAEKNIHTGDRVIHSYFTP